MSNTLTVAALSAAGILVAPIALAAARGTTDHIYWQFDRSRPESEPEPGLFKAEGCRACGANLGLLGSFPALRRLIGRSRCAGCGVTVTWRGEGWACLAVALGGLAAVLAGAWAGAACLALFFWALMSLSVADIDERLLPDAIVFPTMFAGLLVANFGLSPVPLSAALMGLVLGYAPVAGIDWTMRRLTGRMAFGGGDAKLCAAIGAWVGVTYMTAALILAGLIVVVVCGGLRLAGRMEAGQYFSFGPALALGAVGVSVLVHVPALQVALAQLTL